jgi:pantoate--beta-alanine ligase
MNIARSLAGFRTLRASMEGPVGFVPTMGYLHAGHLSLVQAARRDCASVVASIFVNPAQFAPSEDLASYPRDLDRDLALLDDARVDLVFAPAAQEELYPHGFDTWVDVERLTARLEGACRPIHFRGVATIVAKLFHIVQPDVAFFGQKDAQQALVVRRMIRDLDFAVRLAVCPTVREDDGLAMSSRNTYLTPRERRAAPVLYRALQTAEGLYNDGERSAGALRRAAEAMLGSEPLARPEYFSIADLDTLEEMEVLDRPALVSSAVRIGKTRLIDNLLLPPGEVIHA